MKNLQKLQKTTVTHTELNSSLTKANKQTNSLETHLPTSNPINKPIKWYKSVTYNSNEHSKSNKIHYHEQNKKVAYHRTV